MVAGLSTWPLGVRPVDVTRVFDLLGGHPGKGSSGHIVDWRGHHSRADRAHLRSEVHREHKCDYARGLLDLSIPSFAVIYSELPPNTSQPRPKRHLLASAWLLSVGLAPIPLPFPAKGGEGKGWLVAAPCSPLLLPIPPKGGMVRSRRYEHIAAALAFLGAPREWSGYSSLRYLGLAP